MEDPPHCESEEYEEENHERDESGRHMSRNKSVYPVNASMEKAEKPLSGIGWNHYSYRFT